MYQSVVVNAPGKINLALDITGVRADGYHMVDMILHAIGLSDTVSITRMKQPGIFLSCDQLQVPCDESNHAHIAAKHFFERFSIPDVGISIDIQKRIPVQAGMGGGSADAAGVLIGLNALFEVNASLGTLCEIGLQIGADVPFCLLGGAQRAQGIGEQFMPLPMMPDCQILIWKPEKGISTAESYRRYDQKGANHRPKISALVRNLETGDLRALCGGMYNVLEEVADLPEVSFFHQKMLELGAQGAMMTGSGSAVFGLFESKIQAKRAMRKGYGFADGVYLTRPVDYGAAVFDLR